MTKLERTCAAFCAALLTAPFGAVGADPRSPTTKGFVVTTFLRAQYEGKTGRTADWSTSDGQPECPHGFAAGPDVNAILSALKVPRAERERLLRPENAGEDGPLWKRLLHRGPRNADVCANPQSMPDPGLPTIEGRISYGLDLDGADGASSPAGKTCPHEDFIGPNGARGIDNQYYRLVGCIKGRRQGGMRNVSVNAFMRQGEFALLIELRGVDGLDHDDEVQVDWYSAQDPMVNSATGFPLTYASMEIDGDPQYHAVARGRIVDGVLTTEPVDLLIRTRNRKLANYRIRDARLRGEIRTDGSLAATLGGYESVEWIYHHLTHDNIQSEMSYGPFTCPGVYYALHRLADAYPDPAAGGQCQWMSSAYEIEAIPAFVIQPQAKTAGASPTP